MKLVIQIATFITRFIISLVFGIYRMFELYPQFVTLILHLNDLLIEPMLKWLKVVSSGAVHETLGLRCKLLLDANYYCNFNLDELNIQEQFMWNGGATLKI